MKEISLTIFNNEEFIYIIFGLGIILLGLYALCRFTKISNEKLILAFIILGYAFISFFNLGSTKMPETYWQPIEDNESITFELEGSDYSFDEIYAVSGLGDTNNNPDSYQIGFHDMQVVGSNDLEEWIHITVLAQDGNGFYKWIKESYTDWNFKYLKLIVPSKNSVINELGIRSSTTGEFIPLKIIEVSNGTNPYNPMNLIDENDTIPDTITYYDETFFDEIYHARNAYELAKGQYMYAQVHPLLGTSIIALGINIFGANPFGFRVMGALFGVLILPLLYLLLKKMFTKGPYALLGTSLLAVDFMHLTTSRIATLEPFSIFFIVLMYYFMVDYIKLDFYNTKFSRILLKLGLAGLSMSLAWATKWTGMYASIGLALLFFFNMFKLYKEAKGNPDKFIVWKKRFIRIIPYCFLVFVLLPIVTYFIVYIPVVLYRDGYTSFSDFIGSISSYTVGIFDYHAELEATHPFQSDWWQWIFNIRPVWYYSGMVEDVKYTISCFNNPFISWAGLLGVLYCAYDAIRYRSQNAMIITLGYFSSLVPWMFIGRCLFSYHYYPSYPFLILAIVYCFKKIIDYDPHYKKFIYIFTALCVILFVLFLPVLAGFGTDADYINSFLRWFESWSF